MRCRRLSIVGGTRFPGSPVSFLRCVCADHGYIDERPPRSARFRALDAAFPLILFLLLQVCADHVDIEPGIENA
jgi:hypothetical protein